MSFVIRPLKPSEAAELVAIEDQSFATPNWNAADFLKYECLVADFHGKVAGFLVFRDVFPGDLSHPPVREILNVAVARKFRRRGVATCLISQLLTSPAELFLEVRESNEAARQLYRKLGFVEIARRANYYQCPDETAIVMKMK